MASAKNSSKKRKPDSSGGSDGRSSDVKSPSANVRLPDRPRVVLSFPVEETRRLDDWLDVVHAVLPKHAIVWQIRRGCYDIGEGDQVLTFKDAILHCNGGYTQSSEYWKSTVEDDGKMTSVLFNAPLYWNENSELWRTGRITIGTGPDALSLKRDEPVDVRVVLNSRYKIPNPSEKKVFDNASKPTVVSMQFHAGINQKILSVVLALEQKCQFVDFRMDDTTVQATNATPVAATEANPTLAGAASPAVKK